MGYVIISCFLFLSLLKEVNNMEESILTSIKLDLGMTEDYDAYDDQIIRNINSVFVILWRLGVGPSEVFSIEDKKSTWDEFIQGKKEIEAVRTYVYQKVKLIFDPPQNSAHIEAIKQSISEFEWTLNLIAESETQS